MPQTRIPKAQLDSTLVDTTSSQTISGKSIAASQLTGTVLTARLPTGVVVDRAFAQYTANTNLTTVIPIDDTIPQNTEGVQILSASITPKTTTNIIRARFAGFAGGDGSANTIAAMFTNSNANAVQAVVATYGSAGNTSMLTMDYEFVPGSTSAQTVTVRAGPGVAGTMRMNGSSSARFFGGAAASTLTLEEISA